MVGGVLFFIATWWAISTKDKGFIVFSIASLITLFGGVLGIHAFEKHNKEPEVVKMKTDKQYQTLIDNVKIANKQLQKFYIDHPEYKVEE